MGGDSVIELGYGHDMVNVPVRAVVLPRHTLLELRFEMSRKLLCIARDEAAVPLPCGIEHHAHDLLEPVPQVALRSEAGVYELPLSYGPPHASGCLLWILRPPCS